MEKLEREKQERLERERQEKERREKEKQERLEKERIEKERLERERQERLEKERLERLEREKQKQLEKERQEKERQERERQVQLERERKEKERLEREKQKQLEKERNEKLRLQKLTELDTTQTDSDGMRKLKYNKSRDNIRTKKNKVRLLSEKKEEDSSEMTSPKYETAKKNKFIRFTQTPEEAINNEVTMKKQSLFLSGTEELKENELIRKPRREDYRIEIPSQKFTKGKIEDESEEDSKFRDKGLYKGKKIKMNIRIDDDNSSGHVASEHFTSENVNKYENFRNKRNKKYNLDLIGRNGEENEFGIKSQKIDLRHKGSLKSNLSESFLSGIPTKIKIYKCVIWRNIAPGVNEDTIKQILHRSGSQILKKGGFVVKLKKKPL